MDRQQLSLALGNVAAAAIPLPHLGWPAAADGGVPFDDALRFFEPWWPGAQAFLRLHGDHVELRTEHLSDPLAAFPELRRLDSEVQAATAIIEGFLLALDEEGRPDTRLLRQALDGSDGPTATGAFVATDLPWLNGEDLRRAPYAERRQRLGATVTDTDRMVTSRGLVGEGVTLAHAVGSMGLNAISARRLDGRWRAGSNDDAWLKLRLAQAATEWPRPFLVLLERLPLGD